METKHATLPEAALESTLDAMRVGDHGFTVPWAMDVDSERRCWLRPSYTFHAEPGGTVQMRIERREDGYHAWLVAGQRYQPRGEGEGLPVVELHEEDEAERACVDVSRETTPGGQ